MNTITDYIPFGHDNAISRKKLAQLTGLEDASMRKMIMRARLEGSVIIPRFDGGGYFQPVLPDDVVYVRKFYSAEAGRNYASRVIMDNLSEILKKYDGEVPEALDAEMIY